MEGKELIEPWEWQDEAFGLDTDSPLAISQTLWDDLAHSEADVRTLFESTPASDIKLAESSELLFEKQDDALPSSSGQHLYDDSPRLKRRRMLHFSGEQPDMNDCHPSMDAAPEALESCNDSFIDGCEDFRMHEPTSPTSMWYLTNDESLSSVDDAVEQSAESWMARCFNDREAQVCHSQISVGLASNGIADCNAAERQVHENDGGQCPSTPYSRRSMPATRRKPLVLHGRPKLATPVAYPFAVVKPSGTQGDVTLNDINQRIMMPPSRPVPHLSAAPLATAAADEDSSLLLASMSSSAMSGKSVVALTKIHTEGKGTITIMRTKN